MSIFCKWRENKPTTNDSQKNWLYTQLVYEN